MTYYLYHLIFISKFHQNFAFIMYVRKSFYFFSNKFYGKLWCHSMIPTSATEVLYHWKNKREKERGRKRKISNTFEAENFCGTVFGCGKKFPISLWEQLGLSHCLRRWTGPIDRNDLARLPSFSLSRVRYIYLRLFEQSENITQNMKVWLFSKNIMEWLDRTKH